MHRILSIFFLVTSMALAWWALELQAKLVVKEKQIHDLRKANEAALAAEKNAKSENAPLSENIARLTKERDDARASAGANVTSRKGATDSAPTHEDANANLLSGLLKQMDSPEMKEVMRTQQLSSIRKEYAALLKKWNLSPADAEAFLNVMADKELGGASEALSIINGTQDEKAVAALVENTKKREAEAKERIKSILGEERMKEIDAFDKERERDQVVSRYSEHLDIAGFPLNAQQRNQLSEVMQGEVSSKLEDQAAEMEMLSSGNISDETIAKMRRREEEKQTRIIQKATGFLSPDQVAGLQSAFREQNQEQEAGLKMMTQFMKSGSGAKGGIINGGAKVEIKTFIAPSTPAPSK
jgi:hypothetical protein